jgi:hypothetical protein
VLFAPQMGKRKTFFVRSDVFFCCQVFFLIFPPSPTLYIERQVRPTSAEIRKKWKKSEKRRRNRSRVSRGGVRKSLFHVLWLYPFILRVVCYMLLALLLLPFAAAYFNSTQTSAFILILLPPLLAARLPYTRIFTQSPRYQAP